LAIGTAIVTWRGDASGDDANPPAGKTQIQKAALAKCNELIGGWRGTGQPRRGSARGAWRETAEWVWEFEEGGVAIRFDVTDGRLLTTGRLTYDAPAGKYKFVAQVPDDEERTYTGAFEENKLVLESAADADGELHRITVTPLNEKRTLVLFEKRREEQRAFSRVAEVGYTREGTRLAFSGTSGPECVVTGGTGTMPVMYKGQTYYVCCSGCRQAFEDDPEGVIAEYKVRLAQEAAERKAALGEE